MVTEGKAVNLPTGNPVPSCRHSRNRSRLNPRLPLVRPLHNPVQISGDQRRPRTRVADLQNGLCWLYSYPYSASLNRRRRLVPDVYDILPVPFSILQPHGYNLPVCGYWISVCIVDGCHVALDHVRHVAAGGYANTLRFPTYREAWNLLCSLDVPPDGSFSFKRGYPRWHHNRIVGPTGHYSIHVSRGRKLRPIPAKLH